MDEQKRFDIYYSESAIQDIEEKIDYISYNLSATQTAMNWYLRLRDMINEDLSSFPFKFPSYNMEPWKSKGIRIMVTRTDVVLYSVDEPKQRVYIRAICTKGRDLAVHLEDTEQTLSYSHI